MSQNCFSNKLKHIDLENGFKKVVYIVENSKERRKRLDLEAKNKIKNSNIANINNINNCGSLFVKDFEIQYLRKENINKPQICFFKPLPENLNPFLAIKFDLSEKRFIDLKSIKDSEENISNIFSLDIE